MDEVNVVIDAVLPVQTSLPPQSKERIVRQKDENSSFVSKMNEQGEKKPTTKRVKQDEVRREEVGETPLVKKKVSKEKDHAAVETKEQKTTTELLLAVSEQMVAIEQLRVQPELLYQYIQKIQTLYETYGNIKLEQLPQAELQELQAFLANIDSKNAICLEDTIQTVLEKVTMPNNLLQVANMVETETCDITKKQDDIEKVEEPNVVREEQPKQELPEIDSVRTGSESFGKLHVQGADQMYKQSGQGEKVTLSDLGNKMRAQVEALQKFVVKQERVLFQLNPEKLGTLTVFMKKHGEQIEVHVELEKHDSKKRVEIIFDELKLKLKEKNIHIQLTYTNKDGERKEQEQQQRQKQRNTSEKKRVEESRKFAGLLEE
ncbi:flagellar hook-length control protein FliK [Bacillus cytotoxicus]|uniref:flagellar hook-length control protein FliK n=1 Tax=Bacillus cytotoxicus TaxID=580165 RepID=UPI0035CAA903